MKKILSALGFSVIGLAVHAQSLPETFPANGVKDNRHTVYAFSNAVIVSNAHSTLSKASLLVQDDKIVAIGTNVTIPQGAIVNNLNGKYIYPSFVEAFSDYGLPESKKAAGKEMPQMENATKGAYNWNQAVKPEQDAFKVYNYNEANASELRKLGFGAANIIVKDGIFRGTSALVSLAEGPEQKSLLVAKTANNLSFDKGSSTQDYPASLMGVIALIRQTYYDAAWYKKASNHDYNIPLEFLNQHEGLAQIFECNEKYNLLRAAKIAKEFNLKYILKSGGDEYQRLEEVKKTGASLIVPINFPKTYEVEDAYDALNVSLGEMKHWELAPSNLAQLYKAGIPFCITTSDLKDKKAFWKNLKKAIEYGLPQEAALEALTSVPAQLLNASDKLGSLKANSIANFFIADKNIFEKDASILENWVQGRRYEFIDMNKPDLRGTWNLQAGSKNFTLKITGELGAPKASVIEDTSKLKTTYMYLSGLFTLEFETKNKDLYRLSGSGNNKTLAGKALIADKSWEEWSASKTTTFTEELKKDTAKVKPLDLSEISYPLKAYGFKKMPPAENILFKNATVWTNESDGILTNADVLIANGKIQAVGKNLNAASARVIDASGKHISSGIIDEHSHIAISRGVNEGTQAVTSEVRIGDVLNPDDVNIYRQLGGGVTCSQLLHGSANPIGGQSQLIKLRWGKGPEEIKFEGAAPFIKFALGENVKQSNWGERQTLRYPQTRMGVEQVMIDAFSRAKAYEKMQNDSKNAKSPTVFRKDLELDALVEILNKKRFITCHSYVQSEINMLLHTADSMGFKVNTFTHILEGYKVADKMKAHGANGSTFADWWAYKYEVIDAIPYNAAIMTKMGINTAINSDDAEMARRLNQEAAKTMKYGGLSPEEAWKLCTLNPAKMLHVDDKVGSLKPGKDADIVLWSDNPLSVYARAEQTYVDGVKYFDLKQDEQLRAEMRRDRNRIVKKMLEAKAKGEASQKAEEKWEEAYDCDGYILNNIK